MKTVGVLGCCNCGGKVILDVEAVSPRGVVDRRVLTADVDAGLTRAQNLSEEMIQLDGQTASLLAEWRRGFS